MSTRCQIGFYQAGEADLKKFEALLYRHSDGYPGTEDGEEYGVLSEIVPFLRWFDNNRGTGDLEYVSARLLQHLCALHDKDSRDFDKDHEGPPRSHPYPDGSVYGALGYGICKAFHGDIQYFYRIDPKRIEVWEVTWSREYDLNPPEKWKKIQTVQIKQEADVETS